LRGLRIGGAHVAPWHGNIIINTGRASAAAIRALVDELVAQVHAKLGIRLEPEVLFIGAW
jgi:UDP-N-acetylmuramate dehydrogenase